ncbi:MAG: mechanosensitive ion channel family protein [Kiritimatiellae bacterium]|nr:mechanosensitive ion channel family protein [Kiritimatiellia bacterium]
MAMATDIWNHISAWLAAKGVDTAINIGLAIVLFLVGRYGIALLEKVVRGALSKGGKQHTLFIDFIVSTLAKVGWIVIGIMILSRLGVDVTPLVAGLGVTGFIVGFACQETLGNLASGMMIAVNEPFKVGDFVEVAGLTGSVKEVNMMATVLATPDNKRITVPNKNAWGSPITNYSALGRRRVDMKVGVAYGSDLKKAIEVIGNAVSSVEGVLDTPAPSIFIGSLDDSAITINVRPWSLSGDYWRVYSASLDAIHSALNNAGIEIPFPQLTVHQAS